MLASTAVPKTIPEILPSAVVRVDEHCSGAISSCGAQPRVCHGSDWVPGMALLCHPKLKAWAPHSGARGCQVNEQRAICYGIYEMLCNCEIDRLS